jgi:hypothetical protein
MFEIADCDLKAAWYFSVTWMAGLDVVANKSRKASLLWVLRELASRFDNAGWRLLEQPKTLLHMISMPANGIEHALLIHEPFRIEDLPRADQLGIACTVNVYFSELEQVINTELGRDQEKIGKMSVHLGLSRLVPTEHLFAGNVHLLTVVSDDVSRSVKPFLDDFEEYLEPVRRRLCELSVFADEGYMPPTVDPWAWSLRRVAYHHLFADAAAKEEYFSRLDAQAVATLDKNPQQGTRSFVFTDISALLDDTARLGAEECRQLTTVLREHATGSVKK